MLRRLAVLLIALSCASIARAVDTYACFSGYAEQGGAKVVTNGIDSATRVQRSFPGATVTIYDHGTLNLSSIFDTGTGGVKTNPFTASSTALAFWCALPGMYDIQYSGVGVGITTPFTISDVGIAFFPLPFPFTLSGNTTELMTVNDITGGTGATLCVDASGNATTMGCTGGGGGGDATSIQGVPVTAGIPLTPGVSLNINSGGTAFVGQSRYDVDSRDCGLPTDQTDAFATMKACLIAHPSARIRMFRTAVAAGSCDYNFSDTLWMFGTNQWIDGRAQGAGNTSQVTLCWTKPGVSGIASVNSMAQGTKISNLGLFGAEAFSRTTAATFLAPFGLGYPGIEWVTGTATAASTTLTVNGTNEAWTSQTDNATVQIYGAGATQGTVSMATTAASATGTCTCTPTMIGETVAVPGAGVAGGILYAKILGITGGGGGPASGNALLDRKATGTVGAVSSVLALDYYGTISSHASASSATVTPAITTAVTNSVVIVGSQADGIVAVANGMTIENNLIRNWGRDGIHAQSGRWPDGTTTSQLSDSSSFRNNVIQLNRGNGIFCQGGDCNVNLFEEGTISQNQYWGIDDSGFLFNTISSINSAGNHNDCTILPCPALGGATGGFKNTTATWMDGVPYTTANAPPIFVTDGTCTNASNVVTTTATGKFTAGQADATNGQIVVLAGCGAAAAPLTTFITGFTNTNSITVNDAAACGGGCPTPGTVTVQVYPTVTITGAPLFDPAYVGHTILLQAAGADGQALVTTSVIYYSTTKMGINAAPTNRSRGQSTSIYFGSADYTQQLNWAKSWDFTSGAITTGTTALTVSSANEKFVFNVCQAAINLRVQITVVGAGPGGIDHNATCTNTLTVPVQAVTLSAAAGTTVGPSAEVRVGQDGGSYAFRSGFCENCYEEVDQFLNGHKFGSVSSSPAITNVPATPGISGFNNFSPISNTLAMAGVLAIGNFSDTGGQVNYFAGRNKNQQFDINWCDIQTNNSTACPKNARITVTSTGTWQLFINELGALTFAPGALRDYLGDTAVTSGIAHRFKVNSTGQQGFAINADGSLLFSCNSASTNCGKFIAANSATRTYTLPDATGTVALTTGTTLVYACGTTTTCSAALQASPHMVQGIVTLTAGSATVTAIPAFTSTTSYRCTASDNTSVATSANAVPASTTSITVTGTASDVVSYHCVGN